MSSQKRIAIYGSTGSIGTQALEVIAANPTLFSAEVLTAQNNDTLLIQQALQFNPNVVVIGDEKKYLIVKEALASTSIKVFAGEKALEEVVAQYPNTEEGKQAQDILSTQVPALEKMEFTTTAKSWKILFKVGLRSEPQTKEIEEKIKQFIADEKIEQRSYSYDVYTDKENFIVIHHIKSEAYANDIINYMTVNKQYTINQPGIILSSDNYKVVQIKKNLDSYLASKKQ